VVGFGIVGLVSCVIVASNMPLIVSELEPFAKEAKKDEKSTDTKTTEKADATDGKDVKKIDGRSAPGMEGMSDEAVRKFEEAMELEYQKREGGA
jgi:hypothetical protein